jgi:nitronate monooxygenase
MASRKILKSFSSSLQGPFIVSAPMRPFAQSSLAAAVSKTGGFGFISHGPKTAEELSKARSILLQNQATLSTTDGIINIGVGYQIFQDKLDDAVSVFDAAANQNIPRAAWLFAPTNTQELKLWSDAISEASKHKTEIWIQVGSVQSALDAVAACGTDIILVAQGSDAGGHGLVSGSSIIALVPNIKDALAEKGYKNIPVFAAGGIVDGRGVAAALALGAYGAVLGTRFLASKEAEIPQGFQKALIESKDGGQDTARTRLYDSLRGTDWPREYDGRALLNQSFFDDKDGVSLQENQTRFKEAAKNTDTGFGVNGRLVTYAGSGVGAIKEVVSAVDIVKEILDESRKIIKGIQF